MTTRLDEEVCHDAGGQPAGYPPERSEAAAHETQGKRQIVRVDRTLARWVCGDGHSLNPILTSSLEALLSRGSPN
ncbi:MAG: hypothetical protein ACJA0P_003267 [Planctomycetota bacterium]|jgi:hypothetical protein